MNSKKILLASLAAAFAAPAFAVDYSVSGFGTVGVSKQNNDYADFVRPLQPSESSVGLDSSLGVQLNANFNSTFSATAQMLARRSTRDEFKVKPELAFVKAQLTPTMSVRVGRTVMPAFLVSDFRNVGYANIAIRPQAEVYGQVSFSSLDGIDFTASTDVGSVTLTGNIGYGKVYTENTPAVMVEANKLWQANITADFGNFQLRLAHVSTPELTAIGVYSATGLIAGLRSAGFGTLANDLDVNAKHASFTGLGFSMDYKNVLVQAEVTKRETDSYVSDQRGSYLTVGYRMGDWVPYATYATTSVSNKPANPVPKTVPQLAPLSAGVDALTAGVAQSSNGLGVRWNFAKSASLKVQADWVKPDAGNSGYLVTRPGYKGETVRAIAAAVDFVF